MTDNPTTLENLVQRYIALRDKKAELAAAYKKKVEQIDQVLSKVDSAILQEFNRMGVESVRTPAGTAYKTTRTSAPITDWDAILTHIRENEAWYMLEKRVSKAAIESYKDEFNDLPPGVSWREDITINVRRS